ncbi:unnamed protein product [Larinioides sclopetarius]|uniref:Uncharacterized protein n=1 Tax=Larinioides sclopetarius TaxID=280406 RepID=A0AAV1ZS79_9ARAC
MGRPVAMAAKVFSEEVFGKIMCTHAVLHGAA